MKRLLFFFLLVITFASCGKYSDGTSVWGGGAFVLPWLLLIGAGIFGYYGYQSWKSGTITGGSSSNPDIKYSSKRLPWFKVWQWDFAAILIAAAIIIVIAQNADK